LLYNIIMKRNISILYVDDNDFIREEAVEYLSLLYTNVLENFICQNNIEVVIDMNRKLSLENGLDGAIFKIIS